MYRKTLSSRLARTDRESCSFDNFQHRRERHNQEESSRSIRHEKKDPKKSLRKKKKHIKSGTCMTSDESSVETTDSDSFKETIYGRKSRRRRKRSKKNGDKEGKHNRKQREESSIETVDNDSVQSNAYDRISRRRRKRTKRKGRKDRKYSRKWSDADSAETTDSDSVEANAYDRSSRRRRKRTKKKRHKKWSDASSVETSDNDSVKLNDYGSNSERKRKSKYRKNDRKRTQHLGEYNISDKTSSRRKRSRKSPTRKRVIGQSDVDQSIEVHRSNCARQQSSKFSSAEVSIQVTNNSENEEEIEKKPSLAKRMIPMSREQYEAQQSMVREVYDQETGRVRLVRGNGEVIERMVSRRDHALMNKRATLGDGTSFSRQVLDAAFLRR